VTDAVPRVAELVAFRVSVLEDVAGFGLNDAVTPAGRPTATKLTSPLKPLLGLILMLLVVVFPWTRLTEAGAAVSVKLGEAVIVMSIVADSVMLAEVAVTVMLAGPSFAEPLALMVSVDVAVSALVTLTESALNVAVTPLGNPETDSFTLPVKPLLGVIVIVLVLMFC
jgi:hypothetical protein